MKMQAALRQMQVMPPKAHGVLDYLTGAALLAGPRLLDIAKAGGAPAVLPQAAGAAILGQAAMTDYELGLLKVLPFETHLKLDLMMGPMLALVP